MKDSMKIFVNAALMFALIGFVSYLLIVLAGFLGCCAGITSSMYYQIILVLVTAAAVTFGICMYNNCSQRGKTKT